MKYNRWIPGRPLIEMSLLDFLGSTQSTENRTLETTYLGNYRVSTIFLSMAHGEDNEENPYVFETMVFTHKPEPVWAELYSDRYTSEAAARAGHRAALGLEPQRCAMGRGRETEGQGQKGRCEV